jgi:hypothetical protein
MPRVAIIVPTWNQRDLVLDCLDSLDALDYPAHQHCTVVVDNASTDGTVQAVQTRHPLATVLELEENQGYAAGSNAGIRWALADGAQCILLLNNDVLVAPDMLSELVTVSQREPSAGFLGPKVYHREEPQTLQSAGISLDPWFHLAHRGQDQVDQGQFETSEEVDAVSGCAMLVGRSVLDEVGLLDPGFFMYYEEVDWCLRARAVGYRNLFVPRAKVWHRKPQLRSDRAALTTYYMSRNIFLLLAKHGARPGVVARVAGRHLMWLVNWTLNPKWRGRRAERDALLQALLDVVSGKYGRLRVESGS